MGKVPDGNTISDYDKEEIKRQFSISTTLIPLEYEGENGPVKINLLDTPGFFDFVGEAEEAISVADAAIIVVNCKAVSYTHLDVYKRQMLNWHPFIILFWLF